MLNKLHNCSHIFLFIVCFCSCSCFSTAKLSEVKMHVLALLNRHSMVFGNYRWTEFDEDFLRKHVESVAIVDLEEMITQVCYFWFLLSTFLGMYNFFHKEVIMCHILFIYFLSLYFPTQPLDLKSCSVSIHIFTLNEDGPSTLSLEDDEELSAANHWLLPAGNNEYCGGRIVHWIEENLVFIVWCISSWSQT